MFVAQVYLNELVITNIVWVIFSIFPIQILTFLLIHSIKITKDEHFLASMTRSNEFTVFGNVK